MGIVTLYPKDCTDFSTNGLGIMLADECTIEAEANGMWELTMKQPITDDFRWMQVQNGCWLKAPAPVRESPAVEETPAAQPTVTRKVYRVKTRGGRLHLRTGPSTKYKILSKHKPGVEVVQLEDLGGWYKVAICKGGEVGYMSANYLVYVRDVTDTFDGSTPVTQNAVKVTQARDQLFRVYSVNNDTETGLQTVKAMHAFYDLRHTFIDGEYKPEDEDASAAIAQVFSMQQHALDYDIRVGAISGKVTGEYSYKTPVEALLDPEEGILAQTGAWLIRDNFTAYIIPPETRDMGVTIRRGKNLIGVDVTTDDSDVITRIKPCGKNKDGDPLFLEGSGYIDSPRIGEYSHPRAKKIDYDVSVSKDKDAEFKTDKAARAELERLAREEFEKNGVDLPTYGMEVDFVTLANMADYADMEEYLALNSVHMFDTVTVIDSLIRTTAKLRMTAYEWDVLAEQYISVTLGELQDIKQTTYGFTIPDGSVSGSKLIAGSVDGSALRDLSIQYAKIAIAAIDQLNAESINAIIARIQEIDANEITTDELYASFAEIISLMVENLNADSISTDRLGAALAEFVAVYAHTVGIDFADIKDLTTGKAIIREGAAGELYIDRLVATSANILAGVLGELVIKGEDGGYYQIVIGSDGSITTIPVDVTDGEISAGQTSGGQAIVETSINVRDLNAQNIKGSSAIITEIFADALTAGKITAGQAMIASATIPELYTTAIKAIGDSIDLTANTTIRLLLATNDLVRAWFTFSDDGMTFGKAGSTYSTRVDDVGFHVLQLGETIASINRRQVNAEAFRIGKVSATDPRIILREAPDGGAMFVREAIL